MKLMVVDDEPIILNGIIRMIQKANTSFTEIVGAGDAIDALQKLASFQPDLILTDIHMPEMDGLALIKEIQAQSWSSRFVIITGYDDFAYARQALRYQVVDYLLKPINKVELLGVLEKVEHAIRAEQHQMREHDLLMLKEHILYNTPFEDMPLKPEQLPTLLPDPFTTILVFQAYENEPLLSTERLTHLCNLLSQMNFKAYSFQSRFLRQAVIIMNGSYVPAVSELQSVCGHLNDMNSTQNSGLSVGSSGRMCGIDSLRELYMEAVAGTDTTPEAIHDERITGQIIPFDRRPEHQQPSNHSIDKIVSFVEQNYKLDLSLDVVADHVQMHPNYISMLFRKEMDLTFLHYLHTFRLTKAKQFMQDHPDWPIHTIAELVGYENPRHFFKVFKKFENTTPGQYRLGSSSI